MAKTLWTLFLSIDRYLDRCVIILSLLALVLFLRLPTFFEPYWYGDEGIYLTIGNSLRSGERLYLDVMDHKTPMMYYLAFVGGSQLGLRLITLAAMLGATVAFYILASELFPRAVQRIFATIVFVILTNTPGYEGTIPNGELFVMFFVLWGFVLFRNSALFASVACGKKSRSFSQVKRQTGETLHLFGTGVLFGLATLTKVPAIFDMAVLFLLVLALLLYQKHPLKYLRAYTAQLGLVVTGWICVILTSILYFTLRGSLDAYIEFGLLYNFRYAGSWTPTLSLPFLSALLTLQGKILALTLWVGGLFLLRKRLKPALFFSGIWLGCALVAATLSNRPYPHYFLQVFPPFALVLTCAVTDLLSLLRAAMKKKSADLLSFQTLRSQTVQSLGVSLILLLLTFGTLRFLQLKPYPTQEYYRHFLSFLGGRISWEEYRDQFHPSLADNYRLAKMLRMSPEEEIFIWGNNPLLYAMSGKNPVGRFVVTFHIEDFRAHQETLYAVKQTEPYFVITMNDQQAFLELEEYLAIHYMPSSDYSTLTVWRKQER